MDPWVIDIPAPLRWLLVHGAILPRRPQQSAEAYRKIWTDRGSPLLTNLIDVTEKVRGHLESEGFIVESAMRYGKPSLSHALQKLAARKVDEIVLFPLYPQYSLAATESSLRACDTALKALSYAPRTTWVKPFYQHPLFIDAFAQVATRELEHASYDHLLFSFHGLPERQIRKTDATKQHCFATEQCCATISDANKDCYRAQCFRTAHLIAQKMGLPTQRYTVCFQSRLGNTPWIKPYTDELYRELPKRGVKRLAVMCPAFVADCLETLEEIRIRGRADFIAQGGEELQLVGSLNASDTWAAAVAQMVREECQQSLRPVVSALAAG